jgi:hypothetical protein
MDCWPCSILGAARRMLTMPPLDEPALQALVRDVMPID